MKNTWKRSKKTFLKGVDKYAKVAIDAQDNKLGTWMQSKKETQMGSCSNGAVRAKERFVRQLSRLERARPGQGSPPRAVHSVILTRSPGWTCRREFDHSPTPD